MNYFEQTRMTGRSKWYHWGFVFWITVLGWLLGQVFLTSPLPALASDIDPVLGQDFIQASTEMFESQNMAYIGLVSLSLQLLPIPQNRPLSARWVLSQAFLLFVLSSLWACYRH